MNVYILVGGVTHGREDILFAFTTRELAEAKRKFLRETNSYFDYYEIEELPVTSS